MLIRDATEADVPAINDLANALIRNSTVAWTETLDTLAERVAWFRRQQDAGNPVLVADLDGEVVGYATYDDFRDSHKWPGYRFTVEHTLHVRADARGRGIGTQLLRALIARAGALGKHVMVAGVDADNAASIRLHERLGFTRAGRLCAVGYKFDRWLDLVFLQRSI